MKNTDSNIIRNERESDRAIVEDVVRKAFYNMYAPGCVEHYLVRNMRGHEDFIPELDFVIERNGEVIGNVMYTKATLTDETGGVKSILTFGPVSIRPDFQRQGYGRMLLEHSIEAAARMGGEAIVIVGSPANYVGLGFKSCRLFGVCAEGGKFPAAMLVKELVPGALAGRSWTYRESPALAIDVDAAFAYDDTLEPMERTHRPSQDEFYILSHSFVEDLGAFEADSCGPSESFEPPAGDGAESFEPPAGAGADSCGPPAGAPASE